MKALSIFLFSMLMTQALMGATYEVPMAEGLKEFSTFTLSDFEQEKVGNKIFVRYSLPQVLTGVNQKVELSGIMSAEGSLLLVGDSAMAMCIGSYTGGSTCTIQYNDLIIDQEKALKSIRSISKSETEVGARLEVMKSFSTDPVGIITY